jgi:hypothetical protein
MDELTELDKLIAEEETAVQTETPTPPTDLEKRLKEEEAKKKHWREKAIDPTTNKTYKALYEESLQKPQVVPDVSERLDRIELSTKGLDEDAIGFIKTYAKGAGKSPGEVLTDPAVQMFLEARKQKLAVQDAIPASSSRTVSVGGKSLAEMTPKEREANWSQIVAATRKK